MHSATIRAHALRLRKEGYSYSFISERTGLSKGTLSGWLSSIAYKPNQEMLKVLGKARAASGESKARLRRESTDRANQEAAREVRSVTRRDLFLFGLGLYLGEGSKTTDAVRIVNADPKVIKSMVSWFKSVGVTSDQFAPRLHLYPDSDVAESLHFWSQMTTIPKTQFQTPYIDRRIDKKAKKEGKLPFGTLHLSIRSNGRKEFGVFFARKIRAWTRQVLEKVDIAGLV